MTTTSSSSGRKRGSRTLGDRDIDMDARAVTDVELPEPEPGDGPTAGDQAWIDQHTAHADGDVPDAQAETEIEDIPDGAIVVPLGPNGDLVHVLPRRQWKSSALEALHNGNIEYWARMCLHRPDYENIWVGLDPDIDEVTQMFAEWNKLTGDNVGKATVPRGSLRNGRSR
jgi:hypothetical protein